MPYAQPQQRATYQLARYHRIRREWFDQNGPCVRCGSSDNLQADHKDPSQKVSHRIWSWSRVRREAELAKCQVLCWPCHNDKTWAERPRAEHGTQSMYIAGCRCDDCRSGHASHNARYR